MSNLISIKDFSFAYPTADHFVLENINCTIEKGELVLLCGMSGSGKTTLLRQLKKELKPYGRTKGSIMITNDVPREGKTQLSQPKIAFVMQNPKTQIIMNSVWHELAFGLENQGLATEEIERRIAEIVNFFGIEQWLNKKIDELSGGEQQILNLASNIILQPDILILDEPTSQLDPISRRDFLNMLFYIHQETGTTILLSEHHLNDLLEKTDKVFFLEQGKLIYQGGPRAFAAFLKKQQHPYLEGLPMAVRVANLLAENNTGSEQQWTGFEQYPLSVREGRLFLEKWLNLNRIFPASENRHDKQEQFKKEAETILTAKNIWFRYKKEDPFVLKDLSMEIKDQRILSILGANGSGKSTLLYLLTHALQPLKGKIKRSKAQRIAMLGQDPEAVFSADTVEKVLLEYQEIFQFDKEEMLQLTERFGISHLLNLHPYDISFGEKQRVALVKVLLTKPDILLLDEPTKNLDMVNKSILFDILNDLRRNIAIVIVTHDVDFAAEISDECCMLFNQRIISLARTDDFFQRNTYFTSSMARIAADHIPYCINVSNLRQFLAELAMKQNVEQNKINGAGKLSEMFGMKQNVEQGQM